MNTLLYRSSILLAAGLLVASAARAGLPHARVAAETGHPAPGTASLGFTEASGWSLRLGYGYASLTGRVDNPSNGFGLWAEDGTGLRLVALTGDPAPAAAGTGLTWAPTSFFVANDTGVLFATFLQGSGVTSANDQALWYGLLAPQIVAREGDHAPGTPADVVFAYGFPYFCLDRLGNVALIAEVTGPGVDTTNNEGLWVGTPASLALVAREGDTAPDTAGVFGSFGPPAGPSSPSLSAGGDVAFVASTSTAQRGIWLGTPPTLHAIALTGAAAPGGGTFADLRQPALNDANKAAFNGVLTNNLSGIWVGFYNSVSKVAVENDPAPGGGSFDTFGYPSLNGWTEVAFYATLYGGASEGVFLATPGGLEKVVAAGDPAAGEADGVSFASLGTAPVVNDLHQVLFSGTLAGPGITSANDEGLWVRLGSGAILPVVREGEPVVAQGASRTVTSFYPGHTRSLDDGWAGTIDELGDVVYTATFADGPTAVLAATMPYFADGFESGTTSGWSTALP